MKTLSLSRPLVITVIGLPGSGKSFFSRQFAEMFGAPLVSVDFVRHTLFPDAKYTAEEDGYVHPLAGNLISQLLKTGKTIVIDGGLNNRQQRHGVEQLAAKHGYGRLTVWVQTDEPTSLARSLKRSAKRQYDEYNNAMTQQAFMRYKKQFTAPTATENIVVISGKHTFATQARVVLKKLVSPRDTIVTDRSQESTKTTQPPEQSTDVQPRRRSVTIN